MLLAVVVAGLGFAGCGSRSGSGMMGAGGNSTLSSTGARMMGAGGNSVVSPTGARMMGGVPGYHLARMTCSAPRSLPGRIVNVTLGDMGMTQMMGSGIGDGITSRRQGCRDGKPGRGLSQLRVVLPRWVRT